MIAKIEVNGRENMLIVAQKVLRRFFPLQTRGRQSWVTFVSNKAISFGVSVPVYREIWNAFTSELSKHLPNQGGKLSKC